jgi:hypothetical protein
MKIKLLIAILLISLCAAKAALVDLTPGGFNAENGLPPAYFKMIEETFFDEAGHGWFQFPEGRRYINGWISLYGELDGGTWFFTNLFTLGDTPGASVWWNLAPVHYRMAYIHVWGLKPDGSTWEHIYGVRPQDQTRSHGALLVTVDGLTFIQSISFYGRTSIRGREDN